jgi:hypothetical protein
MRREHFPVPSTALRWKMETMPAALICDHQTPGISGNALVS